LPNTAPQIPDALGGMRSGKSTALRRWTRCGITETLRALITLKEPQWSQRFQWSQWFSGRAQIDEPVGEQAIEDWLRAIAIRPDGQDSLSLQECFWNAKLQPERRPASFTSTDAGGRRMRGGGRFALSGSTEHQGSGVVFSARDLQRGERGKAACVSRAGGFLLPKEAKRGIVCLAA